MSRRSTAPASQRVLRVAELLNASTAAVAERAATLPAKFSAAVAEVAAGTLLTIELHRRWWDRLPRRWVLGRLNRLLAAIQDDTEQTTVVAAALIDGGRVLLAQRAHPPELAGQWEFPGGKLERGETAERALVRELVEELGVRVVVGERIARQQLGDRSELLLFRASLVAGSAPPTALEHRQLRWAGAGELAELAAPASTSLVATNRQFAAEVTARL